MNACWTWHLLSCPLVCSFCMCVHMCVHICVQTSGGQWQTAGVFPSPSLPQFLRYDVSLSPEFTDLATAWLPASSGDLPASVSPGLGSAAFPVAPGLYPSSGAQIRPSRSCSKHCSGLSLLTSPFWTSNFRVHLLCQLWRPPHPQLQEIIFGISLVIQALCMLLLNSP